MLVKGDIDVGHTAVPKKAKPLQVHRKSGERLPEEPVAAGDADETVELGG